jgi:hypothetical protein
VLSYRRGHATIRPVRSRTQGLTRRSSPRIRVLVLAGVVWCCASLLAGCGLSGETVLFAEDETPVATPIRVEAAPSLPTAPLRLDGPVDPSGFFVPTAWPSACELLDDAGLRAVLPQTTGIARTPEALQFEVLTPGSGWSPTITVGDGICDYRLELPGTALDNSYAQHRLRVLVDTAGTAEIVEHNTVPKKINESPLMIDGVPCFSRTPSPEIRCQTAAVSFSVTGYFGQKGNSDAEASIRYVRDGRTEVFRSGGGAAEVKRRARFEVDVVLPELVRVALHNLGG